MSIQFNTAPPPAAVTAETAAPQPQSAPKPAVQTTEPPPSAEAIRQAARQINEFLKSSAAAIEFSVDSQSDKVIVRIVDPQTKEVIRQLPSEEMIAISKSIDRMTSLLLHQKA
jgi:flagellar protein FlaG